MKKTKYFILVKGIQRLRYIFSSNECDLSFTAFIKLTLKHPFCARYYSWDFLLLLPWIFLTLIILYEKSSLYATSRQSYGLISFFPSEYTDRSGAAYNY